MGGFSSSSFAVAAFSVAAFSFNTTPPAVVTPAETLKYYTVDNGAQIALRRQQLEEDEVILALIQQFVLET